MYKYIYIYNNNFYAINDHIMTFPIQKLLVALRWPQMNVALVTSSGQFNPDGEGRCSQELKGEMFLFYFFFGGGNVFKARYPAQRNYFFWNLDYSQSWNKSTPSVLDINQNALWKLGDDNVDSGIYWLNFEQRKSLSLWYTVLIPGVGVEREWKFYFNSSGQRGK